MKNIFVLIAIVCTYGCASRNTHPIHEYNVTGNSQYPGVELTVNGGYVRSYTDCSQNGCYVHKDKTGYFFRQELLETKKFKGVYKRNIDANFQLYVNFSNIGEKDKPWDIAKAIVSGLSLFLIPVSLDAVFQGEFVLKNNSEVLVERTYTMNSRQYYSWFFTPDTEKRHVIESMVSHFMADLLKESKFVEEV